MYRKHGYSATLCELFHESVASVPANILLHHLGRDWTYQQVWDASCAMAGWLDSHGVSRGDRVGILLGNSFEYLVAYFGTLLTGSIAVALNPNTTPHELGHTLVHCEPKAIICQAKCVRHVRQVMDRLPGVQAAVVANPGDEEARLHATQEDFAAVLGSATLEWDASRYSQDDLAQIIYTSGTTGRPKGVTLSHRNFVANCRSIIEYLELKQNDSVFVILPFFYSYGNSLLQTHMAVGGRLIQASDFVYWNRAVDLMVQQRATGFSGVPSTYAMLLHKSSFAETRFPDLRYITCAGGGLAPSVVNQLRECLPETDFYLMYGQTEAAARLSSLMPSDVQWKLGSIGKGIPDVVLSVLNEDEQPVEGDEIGEITAQGENIMVGYWKDEDETRRVVSEHGLHTGDMARIDEDGFIFIVGRRSDMIKSGAYRINPKEIEEVILQLDGVIEVAVIGQPDKIQSEIVVACVVVSEAFAGGSRAIIEHCRRTLPRHKCVRAVHFAEVLPKTASGKIKRHELKERLWGAACGGANVQVEDDDLKSSS